MTGIVRIGGIVVIRIHVAGMYMIIRIQVVDNAQIHSDGYLWPRSPSPVAAMALLTLLWWYSHSELSGAAQRG
jgi:hypothetical protein